MNNCIIIFEDRSIGVSLGKTIYWQHVTANGSNKLFLGPRKGQTFVSFINTCMLFKTCSLYLCSFSIYCGFYLKIVGGVQGVFTCLIISDHFMPVIFWTQLLFLMLPRPDQLSGETLPTFFSEIQCQNALIQSSRYELN